MEGYNRQRNTEGAKPEKYRRAEKVLGNSTVKRSIQRMLLALTSLIHGDSDYTDLPISPKDLSTQRESTNNPKVEKILKDSFRVEGNSSLEDARLIFVGDVHSEVESGEDINQLLKLLARNGDVILIEGEEAGKIIDQKDLVFTDGVNAKILVTGWDNLILRDKSASNVKELIRLKYVILETQNDEVARKLEAQFWEIKKDIDQMVLQRDDTLLETLKKYGSYQRVFIICGPKHAHDPKVIEFSQQGPYVILNPVRKSTPGSAERYFSGGGSSANHEGQPEKLPGVYVVQLSNGTTTYLGESWFVGGENAQVGDELEINLNAAGVFDREMRLKEGFEEGRKYKILEIK